MINIKAIYALYVKRKEMKIIKSFINHPKSINESYFEHLYQAIGISLKLCKTAIIALIHGIFPFICIHSASNNIEDLYKQTKNRRNKSNDTIQTK